MDFKGYFWRQKISPETDLTLGNINNNLQGYFLAEKILWAREVRSVPTQRRWAHLQEWLLCTSHSILNLRSALVASSRFGRGGDASDNCIQRGIEKNNLLCPQSRRHLKGTSRDLVLSFPCWVLRVCALNGQNRQSPIASVTERRQRSHATIPQFHAERMLHQRTPTARFESQHNERTAFEDVFLCFEGGYDRQR